MKQKILIGSPEDRGFEQKNFNFTLRDIFHPSFSRFLKLMKCFAKLLRYWVTVQISKSDVLQRSSNKRKTVRSPSWNKGFQWEARKTVDLSKKLLISLCEIFSPIFFALSETYECFPKVLRYGLTVKKCKFHGLPRSPNKRKIVRSPSWNKRFQWEARKTVDLSKQHSISLCEIFFTHIFRAFWNLWNILRKSFDIDLL